MKLNNIPKQNIYQVPDGYFDQLPRRVMDRKAAGAASAGRSAFPIWKPVRLAFAPLVLLLVFVGVYFLNMPVQPGQATLYPYATRLADQEIVAYFSTPYSHLETSDFEEVNLDDQELTAEFLNISPEVAEEELKYYQLSNLTY